MLDDIRTYARHDAAFLLRLSSAEKRMFTKAAAEAGMSRNAFMVEAVKIGLMLDDIRTYARLQLEISTMTRAEYIATVRKYAVEKHGEGAQLMAERTARHVWDSRP